MLVKTIRKFLKDLPPNYEILIQLPDNEPPVDFELEQFEDLTIIYPKPPAPLKTWYHNTNIIKAS
jgi:hypothetical protein